MSLFDALPYLGLMVYCLLCAHKAQKSGKTIYVIMIIIGLTLFAGFRSDNVGVDTRTYITNLNNGYYKLFEYGFQLLSQPFAANGNYCLYLICIAAIIYTLFLMRLWELRDVLDFPFSVFLFFIIHFSASMNTMRQYIACAIVFWGTRFLFKQKAIPYIACVLLAMLFHKTSFIAMGLLLIYFSYWKEMTTVQKMLTILLLVLLPIGLFYIYNNELSEYITIRSQFYSSGQGERGIFIYVEIAVMILLMIINYRKLSCQQVTDKNMVKYLWLFGFLGTVLSLIGYWILFMGRVALYYSIFTFAIYSIIWESTKPKRRQSAETYRVGDLMSRIAIILVTVTPFILQMINNSYKILPYTTR